MPVVHLEEVEVKTHEEDEEPVYKQRAKLFTFSESLLNKGTGVKTWNERGVGDMKLLKHKETSHIRVLMRQEKTMKVIANHFLDPRIKMVPNAGASDKSWVWVAFDFADGELVETVRFFLWLFSVHLSDLRDPIREPRAGTGVQDRFHRWAGGDGQAACGC